MLNAVRREVGKLYAGRQIIASVAQSAFCKMVDGMPLMESQKPVCLVPRDLTSVVDALMDIEQLLQVGTPH